MNWVLIGLLTSGAANIVAVLAFVFSRKDRGELKIDDKFEDLRKAHESVLKGVKEESVKEVNRVEDLHNKEIKRLEDSIKDVRAELEKRIANSILTITATIIKNHDDVHSGLEKIHNKIDSLTRNVALQMQESISRTELGEAKKELRDDLRLHVSDPHVHKRE